MASNETITKMREVALRMEHAVSEQRTTTREISQNIDAASLRVREVSGSVGQVSQAALTTADSVKEVEITANEISKQSSALTSRAGEFLTTIRK
jgi:methyl-accepting chemotaxis protein